MLITHTEIFNKKCSSLCWGSWNRMKTTSKADQNALFDEVCSYSHAWGVGDGEERKVMGGFSWSAQLHRHFSMCTQTTLHQLHVGPFTSLLMFYPAHTTPMTLLNLYCPRVALTVAAYIPLAYGISCHCHVNIEKCWPSLTFSILRPLLRGFIIKKFSSCWAGGQKGTQIQTVL